ncbi:unnamed protein product, partial [Ilex paraguariensis]
NPWSGKGSNDKRLDSFVLQEDQVIIDRSIEVVVDVMVDLPPLLPTPHPLLVDNETLMDNIFGNDASNVRFDGASVNVGNTNSVHGDA